MISERITGFENMIQSS